MDEEIRIEIEQINRLIDELVKRVTKIEELGLVKDLELLINRVDDIERFLNYRTRGFYSRSKSNNSLK